MKCEYCSNYMSELDTCKYCSFEYDESFNPFRSDDWDIMNLKEEDGWEHQQIMDRLHLKGIDCYKADIWSTDSVAYLIGVYEHTSRIAEVLGLHEESVYNQFEHGFIILNLFQERCIRDEDGTE